MLGIKDQTIIKDVEITQEQLLELIDNLNKDDNVDGMLVQLPLPPHIDEKTIVNAVHPTKDVDGFNVLNIGRYSITIYSIVFHCFHADLVAVPLTSFRPPQLE